MARSNDIQYVRYYTFGSAAQELELPEKKKAHPKPKVKKEQAALPLIKLDGLSTVGLAVAAIMLVCMIVGAIQVSRINAEAQELKLYVAQLEVRNADLQAEYDSGYDLAQVQIAAESMGLVPADQVQHITVSVPESAQDTDLSWWQQLLEQIQGFFA